MDETQAQALKDLDRHWGRPYVITFGSHGWMARRRGNGHLIVAATPEDLEELLEADYAASPAHAAANP